MNDLVEYREMIYPPETALNSILSPILGMFGAQSALNNVKCVKNAIFENYFEQFSHFSTV